jgi:hypothetical protein
VWVFILCRCLSFNTEFLRFKALESSCYKVFDAEQTLNTARTTRDEARKRLVTEETKLAGLKMTEVDLSRRISDDHVVADSKGMHVSEVFPNIHLGNVMAVMNDLPVEDLPFEEVLALIKKFRSPHRVAFKRYDYRSDPITNMWVSLAELRDMVRIFFLFFLLLMIMILVIIFCMLVY